MDNGQSDEAPPGGYFVGRPTNQTPESKEEPAVAAGENTPGGYFIGRPESHHKQEQEPAQKVTTKQSTPSFLAKCCPCLADGGAAD